MSVGVLVLRVLYLGEFCFGTKPEYNIHYLRINVNTF